LPNTKEEKEINLCWRILCGSIPRKSSPSRKRCLWS